MAILSFLAVLITAAAIFSYINFKFLKLPSAIGLIILGLILSGGLISIGLIHKPFSNQVSNWVASVDFSTMLLSFMLSFMLFAGSMHVDLTSLMNSKKPIIAYATIGVLMSALIIAVLIYYVAPIFGTPLAFTTCLMFGAVISPTDPIAATGMLKKFGIPKSLETEIVGESLFNDGIGVILFVVMMQVLSVGMGHVDSGEIGLILIEEVVGGIGLGLAIGYVGYKIIKSIDHYQTEILVTISMVLGGSVLATSLHFSSALAMVAAGLFIGNRAKTDGMSDVTADYVEKFWEMIDEILNAVLFVFMGLELVLISLELNYLALGLFAAIIVLLARFISVSVPFRLLKRSEKEKNKTITLMTWCGLRGGISIALALAASNLIPEKDVFISITYFVVIFSIIIQGMTIETLMKKLKIGSNPIKA